MGKKHREKRKLQKAQEKGLKDAGFEENEWGELRHHMSKAEARRRFLRRVETEVRMYHQARFDVIDRIQQVAKEEIQAEEDARVFEILSRSSEGYDHSYSNEEYYED